MANPAKHETRCMWRVALGLSWTIFVTVTLCVMHIYARTELVHQVSGRTFPRFALHLNSADPGLLATPSEQPRNGRFRLFPYGINETDFNADNLHYVN